MKLWIWFLSSYAPLWTILGLRFDRPCLRIPLLVLSAATTAWLLYFLYRRRTELPDADPISVTGDAGAEVSGYLASYLLPFLTVPDPDLLDLATYLIFGIVAGVIYVRSDLIHVNPTVYLLGWRAFRAERPLGKQRAPAKSKKQVFVLSRRDRRAGEDAFFAERFSDRVYIDHGRS